MGGGNEPKKAASSKQGFRSARARLAAYAMHSMHPDVAREAGRRGGEATAGRYSAGKRAWGVAMALRRWHKGGAEFGSRAPDAGPGGEGGGAPEPGPAGSARKGSGRREKT